jgi:hypothetical protein
MSPRTLLLKLLRRCGLTAPDGRLLCLYRCTDEEFHDLPMVLRDAARVHGQIWPLQERAYLPPCFCLYAAEWWRRNYESGPWAWHDLLEASGFGATIPRQRLYRIVHRGLTSWKRQMLSVAGQRAFLVTLACEGGVPLKLLHRDGTHLHRYFRALLREFQIYGQREVSSSALAARVASVLPLSLRQDVVYELSGNLIECIWELQKTLSDTRTPIEDLDRHDPHWRERLPIVVSDETARALLNNLVRDASTLARQYTGEPRVSAFLTRTAEGWTLSRQVTLPPSMGGLALAHLLGITPKDLPARFQLSFCDGVEGSKLLALVTRRTAGDDGMFAIEILPKVSLEIRGPAALAAVRLQATFGRQTLPLQDLKGGEELSELPWSFVARRKAGNALEFLGEGSVRTRFPEAYIATRPDSTVQARDDALLQCHGDVLHHGRVLYRLEGEAIVRQGDSLFRICTRSAADEVYAYALAGTFLTAGVFGSKVYQGVPRVVCQTSTGIKRLVPESELQWRVCNSTLPWRPLSEAAVGRMAIRHAVGGEIRFVMTVDVAPTSSRMQFIPTKETRCGTVILDRFCAPAVGLEARAQVQATITHTPAGEACRLDMVCTEEPPASVTVHMRWSLGQELRLTIPFPAKGGRFLSRDACVLSHDATVHLDRLAGITAQVFVPQGHHTFFVAAQLKAEDIPRALTHAFWTQEPLSEVAPGKYEVDLQVIQEACRLLFTMTEQLDAFIQLSLFSDTGMELGRRLRVARYDVALSPDRETGEVHVLETMHPSIEPGTLGRLDMQAYPLWTPEVEPVSLVRLDGHRWHFDPEHRQPGPWLITGWDGNWSRVRPLRWSVDGGENESVEEGPTPPTNALSIAHVVRLLDREARREACDALIAGLATAPLHQDWSTVMAYVGVLPSLPATTFDLIVRLAQHPDAAALALVRSTQDTFEAVWSSLERLPFSWPLVSVSAWLRAAERYATALRDTIQPVVMELGGDADALILPALTTFLSEAPLHIPGLQCVVELIWEHVFHRPRQQSQYLHLACSEAGREALRSMVLPEAEQFLLQMHTKDMVKNNFPDCLSRSILATE